MPRIFDNIELYLLPALCETLQVTDRTDFCVGYFSLRGWKQFDFHAEKWAGGDSHCRHLLVSRQWLPHDELRAALSLISGDGELDNQTIIRLKKQLAEEFREQLTVGIPNNEDEVGLRKLAEQIKSKKVVVKLFLRNPLHTKVYLVFRPDPINPIVGYLGSSNLTLAGSFKQGELQVDVLDHDARQNLAEWFEDRWLTVGVRIVRKNLYASSKGVGHGKHSCPYTLYLHQDGLSSPTRNEGGAFRISDSTGLRQAVVRVPDGGGQN